MTTARLAILGLVVLAPGAALAGKPTLHVDPSVKECSVRFAPELTQDAFSRFAREFGSVSAFKQGAPPAALGQWGFSFDVEQLNFKVDEESAAWNDTFVHPEADHWLEDKQSFPQLTLHVGVTDDLDVGAYYTLNPEANYGWVGVDAKYSILHQSKDMPVALAVRGAYTKTLYVTDMDMHAFTADVSVGHTFWRILTPYLAVGGDAVLARETSDVVDLKTETPLVAHATVGLQARYWHLAIGAEAQFSGLNSYQLRVSAVF